MRFICIILLSSLSRNSKKNGCLRPSLVCIYNDRDFIFPYNPQNARTFCGSFFLIRPFINSQEHSRDNESQVLNAEIQQPPLVISNLARVPLEKQFERWTVQQRNHRHNAATYQTMIEICIVNRGAAKLKL